VYANTVSGPVLLGAMFLIRSPLTAGGVSVGVAIGVTLPFAVLTVLLMRLVLRSRKWKETTGREELIGGSSFVGTDHVHLHYQHEATDMYTGFPRRKETRHPG